MSSRLLIRLLVPFDRAAVQAPLQPPDQVASMVVFDHRDRERLVILVVQDEVRLFALIAPLDGHALGVTNHGSFLLFQSPESSPVLSTVTGQSPEKPRARLAAAVRSMILPRT